MPRITSYNTPGVRPRFTRTPRSTPANVRSMHSRVSTAQVAPSNPSGSNDAAQPSSPDAVVDLTADDLLSPLLRSPVPLLPQPIFLPEVSPLSRHTLGNPSVPSSSVDHQSPRKRPRLPVQEEEDDNICNICLEPWTSAGKHHIVCLPCGHLFGFDCIRQWIAGTRGASGSCPTCKRAVRMSEIRYLFGLPARLAVVDTSECEGLRRRLEVEIAHHAATKQKLKMAEKLTVGLNLELQKVKSTTRQFGGNGNCSRFFKLLSHRTTGGSSAGVFDGSTGLLFAENIDSAAARGSTRGRQRVRRLHVESGSVYGISRIRTSKRITKMALCGSTRSPLNGCVALIAGEKKIRILNRELNLAGDITCNSMPVSLMWSTSNDLLVFGTERGEVVAMDSRMIGGRELFRKVLGDGSGGHAMGSKAIHSLGYLNNFIVAATVGGVFALKQGGVHAGPCVINLMNEPSSVHVSGMAVSEGLIAVNSRNIGDERRRGKIVLYEGLTQLGNGYKLGTVRMELNGHTQTSPFSVPGLVGGDDAFVCVGDVSASAGVRLWDREGGDGDYATLGPSSNNFRSVVGMRLPRQARLSSVPPLTQALFGCIEEDCVKVYGAGRYSNQSH